MSNLAEAVQRLSPEEQARLKQVLREAKSAEEVSERLGLVATAPAAAGGGASTLAAGGGVSGGTGTGTGTGTGASAGAGAAAGRKRSASVSDAADVRRPKRQR